MISALDDQSLRKFAEETGGLYYPATLSGKEIKLVHDDIARLDKKELSEKQLIEREDHFQLFLIFGILFLAMELILHERKGLLR